MQPCTEHNYVWVDKWVGISYFSNIGVDFRDIDIEIYECSKCGEVKVEV